MTSISSETLRKQVGQLIAEFENELARGDLRAKVLALVPIFRKLRSLGASLNPDASGDAGRTRILKYFCAYPLTVIKGDELLVVSGIEDNKRRVRELRVQFGWSIASGITIKEMYASEDIPSIIPGMDSMRPSDYILLSVDQDRDAALRWNLANSIRRSSDSVRDKILSFLKDNVGKAVTGEELRYVAGNKTEWARRVRELRTEFGWPIVTKNTGRPDLDIGVYVLESTRQSPAHDRVIPDPVRAAVLKRDKHSCKNCGWTHDQWNKSDPRHLELHHKKRHADGGENTEVNLITLCTVCHDDVHRREK